MAKIFKKCPMCKTTWGNRQKFLEDGKLLLNGYQADFENISKGLFFFTHYQEGCFSTMALLAEDFSDLHSGKRYTERKTGTDECPGYCLKKDQLDRCDAKCECAFVRDIIHIIQNMKKMENS